MFLRTSAWKAISSLAFSISSATPFWTHALNDSRMVVAEVGSAVSCCLALDLQVSSRSEADLVAMVLESVCSTTMPSPMMKTIILCLCVCRIQDERC